MKARRVYANLKIVGAEKSKIERSDEFDYIIAGGGMAGLSLGFYLNESFLSKNKKILIIDRARKNENDHTWCFWEKEKSAFEEIIFRRWNKFWFHGTEDFSELLDLCDYEYKMIRAIDFYNFVIPKLRANPNIEFLQAAILKAEKDRVETDRGVFAAKEFIFESFSRKNYDDPKFHNLRQHFLGWTIETDAKRFDPAEMTLFDFRIRQKGECRFFYVLPFSEKKALVEFTLFSGELLEESEYEENLREYLREILKIENFRITETEAGVIPMSNEPHEEFSSSKILRIGTAGGFVKPSTGYSFRRTQEKLRKIVRHLEKNEPPSESNSNLQNWKRFLDSVLLNVLETKKHPAASVFTSLFQKNEVARVLKFLDEKTSVREDLRIMQTVPLAPFSKAALEEIFKKQ